MKGIWIAKEDTGIYKTSLKEREDAIDFIPVDHPYEETSLGRIYYLNQVIGIYDYTDMPVCDGLVQHVFHPLGENVYNSHPELTRNGFGQKIELATVEDLINDFDEEIPILNDATKPGHLKYCNRLGIQPRTPIPLWEYLELLK